MKLLVAGSRNLVNYDIIKKYIDESFDSKHIKEIVSGHANGVDKLGELYALENNISIKLYKPDWKKDGKSAGFIRNAEMVKYADVAIFFIKDKSRGSTHCLNLWINTKKPYILHEFDSQDNIL